MDRLRRSTIIIRDHLMITDTNEKSLTLPSWTNLIEIHKDGRTWRGNRCTWTNNNNNKRLVDRVTLEILGCCVLISWCLSSGSVNDYCLLNGTTGMELSNIIVTQLYREIDEVGQVYGGRICSWCVWWGKESAKIKEPFLNWNPECHVSCGLALPLPPTGASKTYISFQCKWVCVP